MNKELGSNRMSITLTTEQIAIDKIKINKSEKPDEDTVKRLMASIASIGVLQPIVICRAGTGLGVRLIFGRHRLEACKRLKHRAITARVVNGDSDEIRKWCAYAQIDENHVRRNAA